MAGIEAGDCGQKTPSTPLLHSAGDCHSELPALHSATCCTHCENEFN